jgi:hypothetical protein
MRQAAFICGLISLSLGECLVAESAMPDTEEGEFGKWVSLKDCAAKGPTGSYPTALEFKLIHYPNSPVAGYSVWAVFWM